MMYVDTPRRHSTLREGREEEEDDSASLDSESSGEEIPIWVRGEERFVSGISQETTCQDVINVLLQDEEHRGRHVGSTDQYHITERWRGVEQPLDTNALILDIWNAWGTAQPEVKISLRRIKNERPSSRRTKHRSDSSTKSDKSAFKTIHPKRLNFLQEEKPSSSTDELLRLVLAQGEVIRRQLRKLRHSEHQIGFLEDKTHKARVRKHGSNYLLETYLKGLSEAVDPVYDDFPCSADKNSDSGVVTEGDSEQSHNNNKGGNSKESPLERFSPSSEEFQKEQIKDDDSSSSISESNVKEQIELFEMIARLNKKLLREEETIARLHANLEKAEKERSAEEELGKNLVQLRTEMAKSACEMQHNEIVLEETREILEKRRTALNGLHKDLLNEEQQSELLQALLYTHRSQPKSYQHQNNTKELLDTLV